MSNERKSLEDSALPSSDLAAADAPRSSDAELVLAAIARMEAAVGDRVLPAFDRLRGDLGEMAGVIAQAQAAIKPYEHVADLLRDLERRIGAMMTLVGPEPVVESLAAADAASVPPAAEPERVPTVANVFSQLGRSDDVLLAPDVQDNSELHSGGDSTPTFSMLEAMVEALTAAAKPEPAPEPSEPVASASEEGIAVTIDPIPEPERTATTADPAPEPALVAAVTQPIVRHPIMPEVDLLSSFARMEAVPFLPPEIGTAVIFERKDPPEALAAEPPSAPATDAVEQLPPDEASPTQVLGAEELEPAAFLFEPARHPAVSLLQPSPVDAAPVMATTTAEPEPAAFLLEPEPPAPSAAPAQPVTISRSPRPPHDPLAPLKRMSDDEKIALFS